MNKNRLFLGVAVLLAFSTAACSSGGGGAADTGSGKGGSAAGEPAKPVKLVIFSSLGADKLPAGASEKNNPYIKSLDEKLNLDIQWIAPSGSASNEKLNAMLASGEPLDVIHSGDPTWMQEMVKKKGLQPLNEALDKYGANIKKAVGKDAWKNVTIDGKIYGIPKMQENPPDNLFVRKDWLDKVGLPVPKTIDDVEAVMRAFTTKDPDGNGKADTFGFTFIGNGFGSVSPLFGAFGAAFGTPTGIDQFIEKDGQLAQVVIQPEMKEALSWFNRMFQEKLLDPEFALNKADSWRNKIAQGKVGLVVGQYHTTRTAFADNVKNDPQANWIAIAPPTGKNGVSGAVFQSPFNGVVTSVHVNSKNADAAVKLIDYLATDEGYKLVKFGIEGDVWKLVNGKYELDPAKSSRDNYRQRLSLIETSNRDLIFGRLDALGMEFKLSEYYNLAMKYAVPSKFTGVPTPAMVKNNPNLEKLTNEAFVKIIMGAVPVADFDKFAADFKKTGGDDIAQEVNDWYKANK
jgi:putative aldouronate transport system substrate-binding protein